MKKMKIVLDSSADLTELAGIDFASAPLKIVTDEKQYVDDKELDVADMVETLYRYKGRSATSCPNIADWLHAFGDAEEIFCITITGNLSGSYNAARNAKIAYEEAHPDRRVALIDSLSTGPEIALMAEKIRDRALDGRDFDTIVKELSAYKTELLFVLESMKNLANNGRVSKLAATAAGILGIRAIGRASEEGTLEMLSKNRGAANTLDALINHMKELGYAGGRAQIAHCLNPAFADSVASRIRKEYPFADVQIRPCRGLCSFYAEKGGLLLGFEN